MKYKVGDFVWTCECSYGNDLLPIRFEKHRITEVDKDCPHAPYMVTVRGYGPGGQYHAKSVFKSKNDAIDNIIKKLNKLKDGL